MKPLNYRTFLLFISIVSCQAEKVPTVITSPVNNITMVSAYSGGDITNEGSDSVIERGVCWAAGKTPTLSDSRTLDGSGPGSFTSNLTGLSAGTTYNVRAYATNGVGTSYGNTETFNTATTPAPGLGKIIADHTVVDKFDKIPQQYIDEVKKMWVVIAGESHGRGYINGLDLLKAQNNKFAVSTAISGTPDPYTSTSLRASSLLWGDVASSSGWVNWYGEEDWWTTPLAISRTKAGITYCNSHSLVISAILFAHCYDPAMSDNYLVNYTNYINATQEYIDHCSSNNYSTKVIYTTLTCDMGYADPDLDQYNKWCASELIRQHVSRESSGILFDYYDILSYNDAGNGPATATYNGNLYNIIHPSNDNDSGPYHISSAGQLRLAKAMWWLLARMAGWDGTI